MALPESKAMFPGLGSIIRCEATVGRGVTPGVFLVTMLPQDGIPPIPPQPFTFKAGTQSVVFPDCVPIMSSLRNSIGGKSQRWTIQVADHRWRWLNGVISGEWNVRLADGTVNPATKKSPAELATILLKAMGEQNFQVNQMPSGVWPYVKWNAINPALALASLCDYVGCAVTGGEFARVVIARLGSGNSLPTGGMPIHQPYRFTAGTVPRSIIVAGGPTVFQSKLALAAIAREPAGATVLLNNASYNPTWATECPFTIPSLSGANMAAAEDSLWRWYRVSGQADGSLQVHGCPESVTAVDQYLPLFNLLLDSADDPDSYDRSLPAYLEGAWWPFSDAIDSTADGTRYTGAWQLLNDRGVVVFPYPTFALSSSGAYAEPTFYLNCAHWVKRQDGQGYTTFLRQRNVGGNGADLVLRRFEIFDSVKANWSGTNMTGLTTTTAQADAEAQKYLDIFAAGLSVGEIDDRDYAGIEDIRVDGLIAQVSYVAGTNYAPRTRASTVQEFDVTTPSAAHRRRAELTMQLREQARL